MFFVTNLAEIWKYIFFLDRIISINFNTTAITDIFLSIYNKCLTYLYSCEIILFHVCMKKNTHNLIF